LELAISLCIGGEFDVGLVLDEWVEPTTVNQQRFNTSEGNEINKRETQLIDHQSANSDCLTFQLTLLYECILLIKECDEGWTVVSTEAFRCKDESTEKAKS
jgi:hypothetical protein